MRTRAVMSIVVLVALLSPVGAGPVSGVSTLSDPDAARGLDNLDWNPPPDVVRTAASGVVDHIPVAAPVEAQADDGEDTSGSAEPTETYCVREPGEASSHLFGRGCWKIYRLGGSADPANDYYFQ